MTTILTVDPEVLVPSYTDSNQQGVVSTALPDGGYLLVWSSSVQDSGTSGIYAQRFDANGDKVGAEFRVNSTAANAQNAPAVTTLADGGFVITWQSANQDGSYYGIYGQRYSATGTAAGSEFRVNTSTVNDQLDSYVASLTGGGYVVTWTDLGLDNPVDEPLGEGVYAQRYTANGVAVGSQFRVNTTVYSDQNGSVAHGLDDGGFVVMWNSYTNAGGENWDIIMQRYNASGVAVGGETFVNAGIAESQTGAAIARLSDGGFVVTWEQFTPGTIQQDIYGRRFDANAVAVGGDFRVNTTQVSAQIFNTVTGLTDGGFAVTWASSAVPANNYDIYTQRFDSEGNAIGPETLVNTWTSGLQTAPTIVALPDGGYTISWQSQNQDGSGYGVYQRTFHTADSLSGTQILYGTADADELDGGSGADKMYGGFGDDTYYVNSTSDVVSERANEGTDTVISSVSFSLVSLTNVENLILTGLGNITASGNTLDNTIIGNGAANSINAGSGDDQVYGEGGNDELIGLFGNDSLFGGIGNDALRGFGDNDYLEGGSGNDLLYGDDGDDYASGGDGSDLFYLSDGNDFADGGIGSDTVSAEEIGGVTINLDEDWVVSLTGQVTELREIEHAIGSVENDTLIGGTGGNLLNGGGGVDEMSGATGNDTYVTDGDDLITELSGDGSDTVWSSASFILASAYLENLKLLDGALNGTGNAAKNTIWGNSAGNVLDGGAAADTMEGGDGNDTYVVDHVSDIVREYAGTGGDDIVQSSVSYTLGAYLEALTLTGTAAVNATGNDLDNYLTGNSGINSLKGGFGNDTYVIQNSDDVIVETADGGTDLVYAYATYSISGRNVENATLAGGDNINLTGSGVANTLNGNSGNNAIYGQGGADWIDGGAGNDTMDGGTGNDTYFVTSAGDVVIEAAGGGTDSIYATVTFSLTGQSAENLFLTGGANINATGNSLANSLIGNIANNTLNGGAGNDQMTGGLGADIFLFQAGFRADTIVDFDAGNGDKIQLSGLGSYVLTQVGDDVTVDFGGGNIITVITDTVANVGANIIT